MILHDLITEIELENQIEDTLIFLFKENINFFMFNELNLNESEADIRLQKNLMLFLVKG